VALAKPLAGRAATFLRAGLGDDFERRVIPAFAGRFARDRAFDAGGGFTACFGRAFAAADAAGVNSMIAAPLP